MKVLVTGAAGRIGRHITEGLLAAGTTVTATDREGCGPTNFPLTPINLLDEARVHALVAGHDVVVHLANHPSQGALPDINQIYRENVTMTLNVIAGARLAKVAKIIYASSGQALSGTFKPGELAHAPTPPMLPLRGDEPACPRNLYGLSKETGEILLRHLTQATGIQCIAIRFPWMMLDFATMREHVREKLDHIHPDQCIGSLSFLDGFRFVEALLKRDMPGYHCYLPTAEHHWLDMPIEDIRRRFLSHMPRRHPDQPLQRFVELDHIHAETGWWPAC